MQADLGHGSLEAVLGGQAVVETLVRELHGANQEALLRGEDALTQLYLQLAKLIYVSPCILTVCTYIAGL